MHFWLTTNEIAYTWKDAYENDVQVLNSLLHEIFAVYYLQFAISLSVHCILMHKACTHKHNLVCAVLFHRLTHKIWKKNGTDNFNAHAS